ncbi:3638_t:CDS:2 [Cetraspora pellucida]|uniref:3638_t:CDS:1 n=1 Tax=Cetraspora pellucida TaxID=1433469 RepID=A0A9N9FWR5_9GLOM|nr:3638_t:CDS:2 [Cetraspora pellucida]
MTEDCMIAAHVARKQDANGIYANKAFILDNINIEIPIALDTSEALNVEDMLPKNLGQPCFGKTFEKSNFITFMTMMDRYAKRKEKKLSAAWAAQYTRIKNLFINCYFDKNKLRKLRKKDYSKLLSNKLKETFNNWIKKNSGRLFDLKPFDEFRQSDFEIKFFLKTITKVVMGQANNADKKGQGISAWSTLANSIFCTIGTVIADMLPDSFKKMSSGVYDKIISKIAKEMGYVNVTVEVMAEVRDILGFKNGIPFIMFDNGVTTDERHEFVRIRFIEEFTNFILDVSQYDKKQGMPTQMLEDILVEMFFGNEIMKLYREMRCSMIMNAGFVRFRKTGVKDSVFLQALKIRMRNLLEIIDPKLSIGMRADYDFPKYADFSGDFMTPWGTMPDLLKIFCKTVSRDYTKNKEHIDPQERMSINMRGVESSNSIISFLENMRKRKKVKTIRDEFDFDLKYIEEIKLNLRDRLKHVAFEKVNYYGFILRDLYKLPMDTAWYLLYTLNYYIKEINPFSLQSTFEGLNDKDYYNVHDQTEHELNQKRIQQAYNIVEINF